MTQKWIDEQEDYKVGDKAFLICFYNENTAAERRTMRNNPARTNQSHEDRLHGWCGSYNNVGTHAEGVVKVVRIAKSGRYLVEDVEGDELQEFLEEMGYPDLTEED